MTPTPPLTLAGPAQHLYHLVVIRSLVLVGLSLAALSSAYWVPDELPYGAILGLLLVFGTLNVLSFVRLSQPLPVSEGEFFIQLLLDVGMLSALFYFSGGATNPFISYFLVPICICAATLSGMQTGILTGLSLLSYTLLMHFHVPLPLLAPHQQHAGQAVVNLHTLGMWLNFFISALLVSFFVVRMARDLRRQEQWLNQRKEDDLRNEQVLAVATLAAGTAHELGTPLSTLKVLLGELRASADREVDPADLALLEQQVDSCSSTLRRLVATAERTDDGQERIQSVADFCRELIDNWRVIRPDVVAEVIVAEGCPTVTGRFHPTVAQSLTNLLDNAADASPEAVRVKVRWDRDTLFWTIRDRGPGVPLAVANQLGKTFVTTKGAGLGLGLLLTHATLSRYGGQVRLYNQPEGGTLTDVRLPLQPADQG
ncbi:ATP-binding protein [Marinimicrobium alkaliphilum]|uniref:ATP-binding protein n=1 Tax=Marinimicrobium alkaliphilum TaxID=2202654 RepID=UPI000DB9ADC8|nr:ATP-binding protein [Marinimicrobium alkaliphilum]